MTPPKRWSPNDAALSPLERSLLQAGRAVQLAPKDKDAIWSALANQLPPPATAGPQTTSPPPLAPAAAPASLGLVVPILVGGILGAVAFLGSLAMPSRPAPSENSRVSALQTAQGSSARVPATTTAEAAVAPSGGPPEPGPPALAQSSDPIEATSPAVPITPPPARMVPSLGTAPESPHAEDREAPFPKEEASPAPTGRLESPVSTPPASPAENRRRLAEEAALVREARAVLKAGDARSALQRLNDITRRFPAGVLSQEREVLTIEAMTRLGRRTEASTRAAAFLRAHPESPHAAELRGLVTM